MPDPGTKRRLSATVYYLLTGLVCSIPLWLAMTAAIPDWSHGSTLTPVSLAEIHGLILGFMLTVALGVLYQIVPIAFQARPLPRHVLYWNLPLHILAAASMATGFAAAMWRLVAIGGTLLILNIVSFFVILLTRYRSARNQTPVHHGLAVPFTGLGLVLLIGLAQALWPDTAETWVYSHVLVGAFGFWGSLVMTLSYKLVPMFLLSHGYRASLRRTLTLYACGCSAWLAGIQPVPARLGTILTVVGMLMVLAGLAAWTLDLVRIFLARKRRQIVPAMRHALIATAVLIVAHTGCVISVSLQSPRAVVTCAFLYWIGGLIPLIYAYMQKIVPFLWFEYRFSKRPERRSAPPIDEMVPRRPADTALMVHGVGAAAAILCLSGIVPVPAVQPISAFSALCLAAGAVVLYWALRHVLTIGGPLPPENPVDG